MGLLAGMLQREDGGLPFHAVRDRNAQIRFEELLAVNIK